MLLGNAHSSQDEKEGLIWAIGRWFIKFVDEASAQNSGLMWLSSTNTFARSDGKQRSIDIYINREEMSSLCAFIGPQGVRCIDAMLIQVVADKVRACFAVSVTSTAHVRCNRMYNLIPYLGVLQVATVRSFIATNKNVLFQFSTDLANLAPLATMEASASFMAATVQAGVALALREVRGLPSIFLCSILLCTVLCSVLCSVLCPALCPALLCTPLLPTV